MPMLGFLCEHIWRNFHWTIVRCLLSFSLHGPNKPQISVLSSGSCVLTMHPLFSSPRFRTHRAVMYTALGFAAFGFIMHGIYLRGVAAQTKCMSLDWMAIMAVLNVTGMGFYSLRVRTPRPLSLSKLTSTPRSRSDGFRTALTTWVPATKSSTLLLCWLA